MASAFTQLSQEEQRDQLGCADAWLLLPVSHNPQQGKLLLAAGHDAGRVHVFDIDLQQSVLSASIMPWWWSVTRQLLPAEQRCLEEHLSGSWLSYRACMELLLDRAAGATEAQRHDVVRATAQHCTPFGDAPVRAMDFRSLLETLALNRQIKPVILRVPLLHWLSTWAAQHTGHPLRSLQPQTITDPAPAPGGSPVTRPAPCPISAQLWYQKLTSGERDGAITFPTAITALTAAETKARAAAGLPARPPAAPGAAGAPDPPPAGSSLPSWEQFLDQAPQAGANDVLALIDGLARVPDASASHVAGAIVIIVRDLHVPPKAHQLLNLAPAPHCW